MVRVKADERKTLRNPLLGHAISHRGTIIGLCAIVLWGFMAGLVRLVADAFGATLGSALIYTVGGMMLMIVRRPASIRKAPRKYLIIGGAMFIAYEASISLSIGLASTAAQSVEVSLVNYLWPTLLVLMTAAVSHKRGAVWKALPGAIVATIGVAMAVGGESLDVHEAMRNIASNPLPYALALAGAFIWAVCNRDTCDVRRLRWYDDFLLLRGRSTVGDSLRVRPRLANIHAVDKRICGTGGLCTVDCRRIRLLGLWHVARKHGDAGGRLICHARVLHRI